MKLLCGEDTTITGSLGDAKLDQAVARQAFLFLKSREEARSFTISEFAPDLLEFDQALVLFERLQSEPHLVICGAGHVGAALARLASLIGYRTTLIDDRPEFVSRAQFPDERITLLPTNDWTAAVQIAVGSGRGVSVAVVTRGHNEDEQCVRALIDTTPDYIGLIGSKRRTTIVLERLKEAGASEAFRNRIRAPIGLDIGAVSPEEVALSILAEVVGDRRGGTGGSLSAFRRNKD
jgi:xanthine dehydrogenase accessory factor